MFQICKIRGLQTDPDPFGFFFFIKNKKYQRSNDKIDN
ncbi:MAG: hypothetical protein Sylvanvirus29_9 [Sylvanvirus sp.]|uniref:Uncharacterized protein n=1 Tax=Sylvanvirus sp. TaxID=2487774 RepID=A0A3G5AJ15_9VIRU|nr:MAG: hypothetical protein Sylvanvirus29_9 [Sylvanvirus sp.]